MHIDDDSLERLDDWALSPEAVEGDLSLILEFLRSVDEGSWLDRWFIQTDLTTPLSASAAYVVHLREGLRLLVHLDYDGVPDVLHVPSILIG